MKKYVFKELVYEVEAYRTEDDAILEPDSSMEEECHFLKSFNTFDEAVQKYLELKRAGWEIVSFVIKPKTKQSDVRFVVHDDQVTILVDIERIYGKLVKVLEKIRSELDKVC